MIRMFESSTAWPTEASRVLAEFRPPEPPAIEVDFDRGRVTVTEPGEVVIYELRLGHGKGRVALCSWEEHVRSADGGLLMTCVTTAEVMAVLRDVAREEDAARMTLAAARWFERAVDKTRDKEAKGRLRAVGRRLREQVRDGYGFARVSLRPLQAAILERLVAGETISDMCERGGFVARNGKLDTSWFQRRAGLLPELCPQTGKRRFARTASYDVFCRLARAAGADPHRLGV